jgi:TRAP-type C4-dicarboxylate transport system permease small subunit
LTTFVVTLEVISRSFFNHSFIWVNEITEYILLYIPFFCGAWLLRHNGHIVLDLIDLFQSQKINRFIQLFVPIIGIVVCIVLVYFGATSTIDLYERNVTSITPLRFPMAFVYFIIPIGSLIMLFEFIRKLYQGLKPNEQVKEEVPL